MLLVLAMMISMVSTLGLNASAVEDDELVDLDAYSYSALHTTAQKEAMGLIISNLSETLKLSKVYDLETPNKHYNRMIELEMKFYHAIAAQTDDDAARALGIFGSETMETFPYTLSLLFNEDMEGAIDSDIALIDQYVGHSSDVMLWLGNFSVAHLVGVIAAYTRATGAQDELEEVYQEALTAFAKAKSEAELLALVKAYAYYVDLCGRFTGSFDILDNVHSNVLKGIKECKGNADKLYAFSQIFVNVYAGIASNIELTGSDFQELFCANTLVPYFVEKFKDFTAAEAQAMAMAYTKMWDHLRWQGDLFDELFAHDKDICDAVWNKIDAQTTEQDKIYVGQAVAGDYIWVSYGLWQTSSDQYWVSPMLYHTFEEAYNPDAGLSNGWNCGANIFQCYQNLYDEATPDSTKPIFDWVDYVVDELKTLDDPYRSGSIGNLGTNFYSFSDFKNENLTELKAWFEHGAEVIESYPAELCYATLVMESRLMWKITNFDLSSKQEQDNLAKLKEGRDYIESIIARLDHPTPYQIVDISFNFLGALEWDDVGVTALVNHVGPIFEAMISADPDAYWGYAMLAKEAESRVQQGVYVPDFQAITTKTLQDMDARPEDADIIGIAGALKINKFTAEEATTNIRVISILKEAGCLVDDAKKPAIIAALLSVKELNLDAQDTQNNVHVIYTFFVEVVNALPAASVNAMSYSIKSPYIKNISTFPEAREILLEQIAFAKVIFDKAKCVTTENLAAGDEQTLVLGGKEAGEFKVTGNKYTGFQISKNGKFIIPSGTKVVESANTCTWKYDGGLYTEVKTTVVTRTLFWSKTTVKTVKYYLGFDGTELTLTTSKVDAGMKVISDTHAIAYTCEDDYHVAYCTKCDYREDPEAHDYDSETHLCKCGAIDPDARLVSNVNVTYKRVASYYGFGFWKRAIYSYQFTVKPVTQFVGVKSVMISADGVNWKYGTTFTSQIIPATVYIKVTDTLGHVTEWQYDTATKTTKGSIQFKLGSNTFSVIEGTTWAEFAQSGAQSGVGVDGSNNVTGTECFIFADCITIAKGTDEIKPQEYFSGTKVNFTVCGSSYVVKNGTTWGEFIEAIDGAGNLNINNGNVREREVVLYYGGNPILATDVIVDGMNVSNS